jgi:lipopolysaccharide biosynthesis regulator YciM
LEHLQAAFRAGQLGFEESLELAATYRKKGDLEQAIVIHQSLYGRPGLAWQDMQRAQYELAKDFFQAGILSRAEDLLESLMEQKGPLLSITAQLLARLYVQQKDWHKATELFMSHPQMIDASLQSTYANVLCEQAQQQMLQRPQYAQQLIQLARQRHPESIRPTVVLMRLSQQQKRWREWLAQIQTFLKDHPERIDLLKPSLFEVIQHQPELLSKITAILKSVSQDSQIRLFRAELAMRMQQSSEAVELLKSIDLNWDTLLLRLKYLSHELSHHELTQLYQKLNQSDQKRLRYQCSHCGYQALHHRWHCPQCERWETLQPSDSQLNQKLLL